MGTDLQKSQKPQCPSNPEVHGLLCHFSLCVENSKEDLSYHKLEVLLRLHSTNNYETWCPIHREYFTAVAH